MSESKSFEDIVKRVLVPESKKPAKPSPEPKKKERSEYVSEALNSNSMPDTMTPAGYAGGPKGMPPFSKYTTDAGNTSVDMLDIGNQEDKFAKSESGKPYPLNHVLDQIANSGEFIQNAESMLDMCLKKNNITLTKEQKKELTNTHNVLKSVIGNINKAAQVINNIKI